MYLISCVKFEGHERARKPDFVTDAMLNCNFQLFFIETNKINKFRDKFITANFVKFCKNLSAAETFGNTRTQTSPVILITYKEFRYAMFPRATSISLKNESFLEV